MNKKDLLAQLQKEHVTRELTVDIKAVDVESRTISLAFASEEPYERWWGIEILNCKSESIRMDRLTDGAALLVNHNRDDQVGVIETAKCDDDKIARAVARFGKSARATEILQDVQDGIRRKVSVGYIPHRMEEMKPEEMSDELKKLALENKSAVYRVTDWEPLEISIVSIPADSSVGVGRDISQTPQPQTERAITMPEDPKQPTPDELKRQEEERVAELTAIGTRYADRIGGKEKMDVLVKDAIELKRTTEQFRGVIFTRVTDDKPLETPASLLNMTPQEVKRYSVVNAIRQLVDGNGGSFEKEISEEITKRVGSSKRGGLYLPYDVQQRNVEFPEHIQRQLDEVLRRNGIARRDLNVTTGSAGGYLVGTSHLAQNFIELLRNYMIPGFTMLTGLSSSIDIPKQTGGATITVAATEGADFTQTAPTFGQLTLSPHDIGAFVEIGRRLLIQSSPAVDVLVANDLMQQLALMVNYLALYGSDASGEPCGVFATSGIGDVAGGSIDWAKALEFQSDIGGSNVTGDLKWLLNSATQALLMSREKASGYPVYLMDDNGKMAGKEAIVSEQMAAGGLALGKWSEVIVGEFGTMEILYDRSTMSASGGLRIAVYHSLDVGLRHAGAVSYADDVS